MLDDLGAGEKPRLLVYNKADLVDPPRPTNGAVPGTDRSPAVCPRIGRDRLRHGDRCATRLADLLAEMWEDVDVNLPYSEGELLARVRERGTVDIGYRARDVRVRGRVAPSLANELRAAAFGGNGRS